MVIDFDMLSGLGSFKTWYKVASTKCPPSSADRDDRARGIQSSEGDTGDCAGRDGSEWGRVGRSC